jgi:hypothetical protein
MFVIETLFDIRPCRIDNRSMVLLNFEAAVLGSGRDIGQWLQANGMHALALVVTLSLGTSREQFINVKPSTSLIRPYAILWTSASLVSSPITITAVAHTIPTMQDAANG